jgi:serine/threonine protein phosphatase 1
MIYAIGDIHGKLQLLREVLSLIKRNAEDSGITRPRIVLLGDLIDRGSDSKGVIDFLLSSTFGESFDATILLGNHEDTLLKVFAGDVDLHRAGFTGAEPKQLKAMV